MLRHALFFDSFRRRLAVNAAPAFSLRVWICQMSCQVGVDQASNSFSARKSFPFAPGIRAPSSGRCGADRRNRGPLKIGRLPQPEDRRGPAPWRCASASRAISFLQNVSPKRFPRLRRTCARRGEGRQQRHVLRHSGIHREKTGYSAERLPAVFPRDTGAPVSAIFLRGFQI